ncbi:MAG: choice-of-anchor R domain-containing protein [Verrucomicrobiota bacterium]
MKLKTSLLSILSALAVVACPGTTQALSVEIFDTLDETDASPLGFMSGDFLAQQFITDDSAYALDRITLSLATGISAATDIKINIWDNDSTINQPNKSIFYADYTVAPTNGEIDLFQSVVLDPNSKYWVSMQVFSSGTIAVPSWNFTESSTPGGVGVQPNRAVSTSGGVTSVFTSEPQMMKVEGTAVPEPSSMVALLLGVATLVGVKKLRPRRA